MNIAAIQEQLADITTSLAQAEARQAVTAAALASTPGDTELRNTMREISGYMRELTEDKSALELALAAAERENKSDGARKRRQRARDLVEAAVTASNARIKKAAAVDKAINRLAAALRDLAETSEQSVQASMDYLGIAHGGDMTRRMDHALVFRSEARGESYTIPAIGKALGRALSCLEMPGNLMVSDWLAISENSTVTVEEAATRCAERFGPRIYHHLDHHIGSEEPSNA